jgi:hypothetical protein
MTLLKKNLVASAVFIGLLIIIPPVTITNTILATSAGIFILMMWVYLFCGGK